MSMGVTIKLCSVLLYLELGKQHCNTTHWLSIHYKILVMICHVVFA